MENEHVIGGLNRKRAELDAELRQAERRIVQLRADLDALDRALRLFDPAAAKASGLPAHNPAERFRVAGFTRAILDIIRRADAPMSARDIALRIAADRGMDGSTPAVIGALANRVRTAMARLMNPLIFNCPVG